MIVSLYEQGNNSISVITVVDPGENLTGALHANFGRGGCGGRG